MIAIANSCAHPLAQVIFLLEVGDYRLLFNPQDKRDQAKRICSVYLDAKSESRIAGSDTEFSRVKEIANSVRPLSNRISQPQML